MFLAVDIGNSRQKVALFQPNGEIMELLHTNQLTIDKLLPWFEQYEVQAAIVSSVGDSVGIFLKQLSERVSTILFSRDLKLPITLDYQTPETLGTDRIAAAIGAHCLYPDNPVLIFQAGTCLVTDFVGKEGVFEGGSIAPGLHMRFDALHHGTAHLPLVEPALPDSVTGRTTQESILSGVVNGMIFEMEGSLKYYGSLHPDMVAVMTGGDAPLLSELIKNRIFAAQNLVLWGLFKTLLLNVSDTK